MAGPDTKTPIDANAAPPTDADGVDVIPTPSKESPSDTKPSTPPSVKPTPSDVKPSSQEPNSPSPTPRPSSSNSPVVPRPTPASSSSSAAVIVPTTQSSISASSSPLPTSTSSFISLSSLTQSSLTSSSSSSSSSSTSAPASGSGQQESNTAMIGGIVGAIVGAVAIIGVVFMLVKRQKRRARRANKNMDDLFNSDSKAGFAPMDDYHTNNNSARDFAPEPQLTSPFQQHAANPLSPPPQSAVLSRSAPMQPYAPQLNDMAFHDPTSPVMNYNDIGMTAVAAGYAEDPYYDPHKYQVPHDQQHNQYAYGNNQEQYYANDPYYDHHHPQQQPYYDQQGQMYHYDQHYDSQQGYYDDGTAYQHQHPEHDTAVTYQTPNTHSTTATSLPPTASAAPGKDNTGH